MHPCPNQSVVRQERMSALGIWYRYLVTSIENGRRDKLYVSGFADEPRYSTQYGRNSRLSSRRWSFKFRTGLVARALSSLPSGALVADIGCADGDYSAEIQGMGYRCVGIDRNPTRVLDGKRSHPDIEMIAALATRLCVKSAAVDGIVVINALRYFEPRTDAISELHRILKPRGLLFILCHNATSPDVFLTPPRGAHYLTQQAVASELATLGFEVAESGQNMVLPPLVPAQAGPLLDHFSRTRLARTFSKVYPEFYLIAVKA